MDLTVERVVISSDIKNISLIEKLIDDISSQYDIHSDVYGKLLLGVVEGVNNAIVHGNKLDSSKNVKLEYQISDKDIQIVIMDEGKGFDYTKVPDPTLPENVEKTHGRGIFLMNHLADEIDFEKEGSMVKLTFNL
ncbi:ATP-binding protein [Saccharicrinis fermentans]|uniref:Serine-protein kinase RsbW n=1 Tax=Saccharicrinis fermentans DSM 9555 = JCM 21142 TaxID=869213 RepID=W7Y2L0_9BACT|nr:ATP-binding protein [Saccharicrinis fermentans]GAF01793.1 serine-protein kinase RsbW [Saccharicrinis fermentans DSM 9555 = JCM 21142]